MEREAGNRARAMGKKLKVTSVCEEPRTGESSDYQETSGGSQGDLRGGGPGTPGTKNIIEDFKNFRGKEGGHAASMEWFKKRYNHEKGDLFGEGVGRTDKGEFYKG